MQALSSALEPMNAAEAVSEQPVMKSAWSSGRFPGSRNPWRNCARWPNSCAVVATTDAPVGSLPSCCASSPLSRSGPLHAFLRDPAREMASPVRFTQPVHLSMRRQKAPGRCRPERRVAMIRTVTFVIVALALAGTGNALAQSRHRQTLGAEAAPGTWRPLSLKCGATYEVTFLDNEARDWVEFRLGKLGYGQASFGRNGRLEVVVYKGVPPPGHHIPRPCVAVPGRSWLCLAVHLQPVGKEWLGASGNHRRSRVAVAPRGNLILSKRHPSPAGERRMACFPRAARGAARSRQRRPFEHCSFQRAATISGTIRLPVRTR